MGAARCGVSGAYSNNALLLLLLLLLPYTRCMQFARHPALHHPHNPPPLHLKRRDGNEPAGETMRPRAGGT